MHIMNFRDRHNIKKVSINDLENMHPAAVKAKYNINEQQLHSAVRYHCRSESRETIDAVSNKIFDTAKSENK